MERGLISRSDVADVADVVSSHGFSVSPSPTLSISVRIRRHLRDFVDRGRMERYAQKGNKRGFFINTTTVVP